MAKDRLAWAPMFWEDLFVDTDDMTEEEFALYVRAFGKMYRPKHEGRVASERVVRQLSGCQSDEQWNRVRASVLGHFQKGEDGSFFHTRVIEICQERREKIEQQREAGKKGGAASVEARRQAVVVANAQQGRQQASQQTEQQANQHRSEIRDQRSDSEISHVTPVQANVDFWLPAFVKIWSDATGLLMPNASEASEAAAKCKAVAEARGEMPAEWSRKAVAAFTSYCEDSGRLHSSATPISLQYFLRHFERVQRDVIKPPAAVRDKTPQKKFEAGVVRPIATETKRENLRELYEGEEMTNIFEKPPTAANYEAADREIAALVERGMANPAAEAERQKRLRELTEAREKMRGEVLDREWAAAWRSLAMKATRMTAAQLDAAIEIEKGSAPKSLYVPPTQDEIRHGRLHRAGVPAKESAIAFAPELSTQALSTVKRFLASDHALMVLSGSTGNGKTVAACSMLAEREGMFILAHDLLGIAISYPEKWEKLVAPGAVWVLDELGGKALSVSSADLFIEKVDHLVRSVDSGRGKGIITTNLDQGDFVRLLGPRIADRVEGNGGFVTIKGGSLR